MINGYQWSRGGIPLKELALMLTLVALTCILVLFPARDASALTSPKADYRYQNQRHLGHGHWL